MGRMMRAGLVLLSALVVAAVGSAAAAGEPEFLTKAVVGEAVSSVPFTATIGATYWEGKTSKSVLSCSAGTATGEVTGPREIANTVLTLTGCESGGCKIHTHGHPEGEVVTNVLAGKLNGITSSLPGIKLFSQSEGKGGTLWEWEICGGAIVGLVTGEVTGSVAGSAGEGPSTGKLLTSLKLTFAQKAGAQKYQGFFEGEEAGLMGQLTDTISGTPELAGLSMLQTNKTVPSTWGLGVTK